MFTKTKEKYTRKAKALVQTSSELKKGTKSVADDAINAAKDFKNLPWRKLPLEGWLYIILCIVVVLVAIFFIQPYI